MVFKLRLIIIVVQVRLKTLIKRLNVDDIKVIQSQNQHFLRILTFYKNLNGSLKLAIRRILKQMVSIRVKLKTRQPISFRLNKFSFANTTKTPCARLYTT